MSKEMSLKVAVSPKLRAASGSAGEHGLGRLQGAADGQREALLRSACLPLGVPPSAAFQPGYCGIDFHGS